MVTYSSFWIAFLQAARQSPKCTSWCRNIIFCRLSCRILALIVNYWSFWIAFLKNEPQLLKDVSNLKANPKDFNTAAQLDCIFSCFSHNIIENASLLCGNVIFCRLSCRILTPTVIYWEFWILFLRTNFFLTQTYHSHPKDFYLMWCILTQSPWNSILLQLNHVLSYVFRETWFHWVVEKLKKPQNESLEDEDVN